MFLFSFQTDEDVKQLKSKVTCLLGAGLLTQIPFKHDIFIRKKKEIEDNKFSTSHTLNAHIVKFSLSYKILIIFLTNH